MMVRHLLQTITVTLVLLLSNQSFGQWNTYFDLISQRDSFPDIYEMSFITPEVGVATSELPPVLGNSGFRGGTLILTYDSGRTWATQLIRDSMWFSDVKYLSATKLIASSRAHYFDTTSIEHGAIALSNDGGTTWSMTYFPMRLGKLSVLNDSTILVAAHAVLNPNQYSNYMISKDYGVSWTTLISNFPNERITDLLFLNDSIGFASSATGRILKTVNQGVSWDSLPFNKSGSFNVENLSSPDSINLFCNGGSGSWQEVYHSVDYGVTWSRVGQFASAQLLMKAEFITDSIGFYFGSSQIFKTDNQGTTWIPTVVNGTSNIPSSYDIQFFNENLIYLGGVRSFLRTFNGTDTSFSTITISNGILSAEHSIYPNPAATHFTLELDVKTQERMMLTLYDLQGRIQLIQDLQPARLQKIEIKNLSQGIYFYRIQNRKGKMLSGKLMVE